MKYPFIDKERGQHSLRMLCRVMGVATSGYYAWKGRGPSAREVENQRLRVEIEAVHIRSKATYGSPRITHTLRDQGHLCSENRVARIMREDGIRAKTKKKFRVTTDSGHSMPVADNLLDRKFEVSRPNTVWSSDISFIWTHEGWMYLAVVLDLFSRKIVGWSMGTRMKRQLVIDALNMAITRRQPAPGLLHHSDRGSLGR